MMKILIFSLNKASRADKAVRAMRQKVNTIIKAEKVKKGELNIILVDDKYMQKLNKRYRRKNKPTDVLTFMLSEGEGLLSDIYISLQTAKKQAKEYGCSLKEELQRLAVHGTLHALGYTHAEMRAYDY